MSSLGFNCHIGLTGSIVLRSGRLSDLISQLQELISGVMMLRSHLRSMIVHFLPHRYYSYLGVVLLSNHFLGFAGGWKWRYLGILRRGGSDMALPWTASS